MAQYEKAAKNVDPDKMIRSMRLMACPGLWAADRAGDAASTLCMIAVDQERYVSLNLGDGCIGAWNQDKAKIISRPLNSFGGYTAYLTVDENIEGYIKIGRGDASKWDGFVILSDGMKDKFRTERKFLRMMNRMTEDGNFQMKRLGCEEKEEGNRRDDFSIIVMERANLANCGIYMESFV
ncbi:MAG: protein phosphatase 2C domain-containing protein [[Clostridium] scindens]